VLSQLPKNEKSSSPVLHQHIRTSLQRKGDAVFLITNCVILGGGIETHSREQYSLSPRNLQIQVAHSRINSLSLCVDNESLQRWNHLLAPRTDAKSVQLHRTEPSQIVTTVSDETGPFCENPA